MGGQICRQLCSRPNERGDALDVKPKALSVTPGSAKEALKVAQVAIEFLETAPSTDRADAWKKCEAAWKIALDATK
eukprot:symbB.v1.2.032171.t1/scaffold3825.1/size49598/2